VQSAHATILATKSFNTIDEHPFIVLCGVKNEKALYKAANKLSRHGIQFSQFIEPDLGDQLTAIATEPVRGEIRRVFKDFQLLKGGENEKVTTE